MEGLPAGDGLVYDPAYGSYVTADAGNLERLAQPLARKQLAARGAVRAARSNLGPCVPRTPSGFAWGWRRLRDFSSPHGTVALGAEDRRKRAEDGGLVAAAVRALKAERRPEHQVGSPNSAIVNDY